MTSEHEHSLARSPERWFLLGGLSAIWAARGFAVRFCCLIQNIPWKDAWSQGRAQLLILFLFLAKLLGASWDLERDFFFGWVQEKHPCQEAEVICSQARCAAGDPCPARGSMAPHTAPGPGCRALAGQKNPWPDCLVARPQCPACLGGLRQAQPA